MLRLGNRNDLLNEYPDNVWDEKDNHLASHSSFDAISFGFYKGYVILGYNKNYATEEIKEGYYKYLTQLPDDHEVFVDGAYTAGSLIERNGLHYESYLFKNFLVKSGYDRDNVEVPPSVRNRYKHPGRIWIDKKLISFWKYPSSKSELKAVCDKLKQKIAEIYKIDINLEEFSFDVKEGGQIKIIPYNEYVGNYSDATDQEMEKPHLMPSDEKGQTSQMKSYRQSDIDYKGKKYGKTPIAKYNFEKTRGIAEVKDIIQNEIDLILNPSK